MIACPSCEIALPDATKICPMCHRNLAFPKKLVISAILLAFAAFGAFLWGSGKLKNRVDRVQYSAEDVLRAAQALVLKSPTVHNPIGFSTMDQATVEHWDGRRWRVSGFVDTRPEPGMRVRTVYFAVVLNNGKSWDLEDLQLQSMEFGGHAAIRKN